MSFEDSDQPISGTIESLEMQRDKKIHIVGDIDEHYDEWMDLLCSECDNSLMILQMNIDNTKLNIICSNCDNEASIRIEKLEFPPN